MSSWVVTAAAAGVALAALLWVRSRRQPSPALAVLAAALGSASLLLLTYVVFLLAEV